MGIIEIPPVLCPLCHKLMELAEEIEDDRTSGYRTIRYCCYHKAGVVDYAITYRYYSNEELEIVKTLKRS